MWLPQLLFQKSLNWMIRVQFLAKKKYLMTHTIFLSRSLPVLLESAAPGYHSSQERQDLTGSCLEAFPCSPWGWLLSFHCRCLSCLLVSQVLFTSLIYLTVSLGFFSMQSLQPVLVVFWVSVLYSPSIGSKPLLLVERVLHQYLSCRLSRLGGDKGG